MKKYQDLSHQNIILNWIFNMFRKINKFFRDNLPKSIFYRFLLIVLMPMLLMQLVFFYIFFNRYWTNTSKQNVDILITEIFILNNRFDNFILENKEVDNKIINELNIFSNVKIYFTKNKNIKETISYDGNRYLFFNPIKQLKNELYVLNFGDVDFYKKNENYYVVDIEKEEGVLSFEIKKDRIFIKRVDLIIFWNLFAFFTISGISLIFLKNQLRSIEKLKHFANDFSYLEKDNTNFKPTGAKEIREMGNAFINVVHKMKQLINNRTTMLAQISHDLRTPLTRMKLQLEFIENENLVKFFRQDLEEMEKMINEYLLFAKGENTEDFKRVDLYSFFNSIINDYKRGGYKVDISYNLKKNFAYIKEDSFKRCINNLINNSLRYYKNKILINIKTNNNNLIINVEDDGCGISKEFLNKVKIPYYKLNNDNAKNIGLGLSIVQNIVNIHKGKMFFKTSSLGGLNVELIIPIKE